MKVDEIIAELCLLFGNVINFHEISLYFENFPFNYVKIQKILANLA
jgi:hypothetical protein